MNDLNYILETVAHGCDTAEANRHQCVSLPIASVRVMLAALTPDRPPLTRTQRKVYGVLRRCIVDLGYFPTLGELAMRLGLKSEAGVYEHLENLERAGYISRPVDRVKGARAPITLVPPVLP